MKGLNNSELFDYLYILIYPIQVDYSDKILITVKTSNQTKGVFGKYFFALQF